MYNMCEFSTWLAMHFYLQQEAHLLCKRKVKNMQMLDTNSVERNLQLRSSPLTGQAMNCNRNEIIW